jgi:outer membrane protein OmpA-like peptidoglycan-associated protein
MRTGRRIIVWSGLLALVLASARGDPNDAESSHDYPGWPRPTGFIITDYDEDNPGSFVFPVARATQVDADHMESVQVNGHRYRIRYEYDGRGRAPDLLEMQQYYEKLAGAEGFTLEKTGAVGDVNETFHLTRGGRSIWVYLEPGMTENVLTIVDAPAAQSMAAAATPAAPPVDDAIAKKLEGDGRAALYLDFLPGRPDLSDAAGPVLDQVVKVLQAHPDWHLVIEGHTDSTGNVQDNEFLSAERARAVRGMLINAGIVPTRLVAIGLGGSYPIADDKSSEGRAKNRRIELVVRKEG